MSKNHSQANKTRLAQSVLQCGALALLNGLSGEASASAAPETAQISVKTLSYQDYQDHEDRIDVDAKAVQVSVPVAGDWNLAGTVVHDAISGASPKYHTSALTGMVDTRNAYSASVTRYSHRDDVTLGYSYSSEHDYISRGYSLQNAWSTDDQNMTLTLGASFNSDRILPNSIFLRDEKAKRTLELVAGLTQVVTENDLAQITLRHSHGRGYFADQYKLYDLRPDERNADSLLLRWNHHFTDLDTTLHSSYRYYHDNFGIDSHTLEFEYVLNLPHKWQLTPSLRYYTQTAANFYFDPVANDPYADADTVGAPISVVYGRYLDGLPASMDQRLSGFGAVTWGVKLDKAVSRNLTLGIKFEQYHQKSGWALEGGSPDIEDFYARSLQLGASYKF